MKVAEQLLGRARRQQQQSERAAAARFPHSDERKRTISFWSDEVKRCEAELAALLRGAGDDSESSEAEASAAAATLRGRRRSA